MTQIEIHKINNGDYAVLVDGVVYSEHTGIEGARRMERHLLEREKLIVHNQLLRSLLVTMHPSFAPVADYFGIPTPQIRNENQFLEMLAKNAGIYTGQPEEESEG